MEKIVTASQGLQKGIIEYVTKGLKYCYFKGNRETSICAFRFVRTIKK
jgi:uncharacterized phage-like protein YoqJ